MVKKKKKKITHRQNVSVEQTFTVMFCARLIMWLLASLVLSAKSLTDVYCVGLYVNQSDNETKLTFSWVCVCPRHFTVCSFSGVGEKARLSFNMLHGQPLTVYVGCNAFLTFTEEEVFVLSVLVLRNVLISMD